MFPSLKTTIKDGQIPNVGAINTHCVSWQKPLIDSQKPIVTTDYINYQLNCWFLFLINSLVYKMSKKIVFIGTKHKYIQLTIIKHKKTDNILIWEAGKILLGIFLFKKGRKGIHFQIYFYFSIVFNSFSVNKSFNQRSFPLHIQLQWNRIVVCLH